MGLEQIRTTKVLAKGRIEMGRKKTIAQTLAEEGARAERERDNEVRYVRVGRPPKPVAERGQVYSVRIPVERIEQLRQAAEAQGKKPAVLARDWIVERLDEDRSDRAKMIRLDDARTKRGVATKKSSRRSSGRIARRATSKSGGSSSKKTSRAAT
jgi:hypothetical protein